MTPTHRYRLSLWRRIAADTPADFRSACVAEGLSSHTIERTILVAIHYGLTKPDGSQPLRHRSPSPNPPSLADIAAAYEQSDETAWPVRMTRDERHRWWQGFLCFSLYTGLRLGDLTTVRWTDVAGGVLRRTASKTGKHHEIPLTAAVSDHLSRMPCRGDTLFGLTACYRQLRRELAVISQQRITPQKLRQASMLLWWKAGGDRAVEIVHGTGIRGVLSHYLSARDVLAEASLRVELPSCMLPAHLRDEGEREATELATRYRMAPSATRRLLLDLSRRLA